MSFSTPPPSVPHRHPPPQMCLWSGTLTVMRTGHPGLGGNLLGKQTAGRGNEAKSVSKPGNARSWGCLACIYIYMYVCVCISVCLCVCVRAVKKNKMYRLSCSPAVFAFRRLLCIHGQPPRAFSFFYFFPLFFSSFVTARERRKTRGWWWWWAGGGVLGNGPPRARPSRRVSPPASATLGAFCLNPTARQRLAETQTPGDKPLSPSASTHGRVRMHAHTAC